MVSENTMNFFIVLILISIIFSNFIYLLKESFFLSQLEDVRNKGYREGWNDAQKQFLDVHNTKGQVDE